MFARTPIFVLRSRRAFVMLPEAITAMCIVAMLVVVLSIALGAQRRAERRVADQLQALRQAEAALATLQSATPRQGHGIPANTQITPLPNGWSRVTVTVNHASATLVGPTEGAP
jgi:type II secretory pathway pseudopilin PulG